MKVDTDRRAKISEKLTTGLSVLAAAVAITAAYTGGLARVSLNEGDWLAGAVALIVVSIAVAFGSWAVTERGYWWWALAGAALLTWLIGIGIWLAAVYRASDAYDRPQVSASYDGRTLEFTAEIDLLRADRYMTVTVTGYPARLPDVPENASGEIRGSQLYSTATGPSPEGTAHLEGRVPVNSQAYEQVEIRAYAGADDPQCLRKPPAGEPPPAELLPPGQDATGAAQDQHPAVEPKRAPAGCATIWIQPRPPALQCGARGSRPSQRGEVTRVPCPG
jgi:hypothetical protein